MSGERLAAADQLRYSVLMPAVVRLSKLKSLHARVKKPVYVPGRVPEERERLGGRAP